MDNKVYDPAELAYKWEQGTISPEEQVWFEKWYMDFNDTEVLIHNTGYTTSEQIRDTIFERISAQMQPQKQPVVKVIRLWKRLAAAAIVLFVIGLSAFYHTDIMNLVNPVQQVLVSSNAGQHRQISLPDGTKVWLSPSTQMSYPDRFSSNNREVKLVGEAFFEVVHDTKHPFIINSDKLKTVVLGTSFNVRAYPKARSEEVTVVSGKVGVMLSANHQQQKVITANQRTVFYPSTGILLKEDYPDGARFLDQRNGLFHLNGASLDAITSELQLQYGVSISIAPGLGNKTFYGSLNTTIPAEQTMNKLCTVLEIQWNKKNGIYYLRENIN